MPFYEQQSTDYGMRAPGLLMQKPEAPEGSLLAAAARQENTIVSAYNYMTERSGFTYDPDHNPIDVIKDTKYEANYLDRFIDSRSGAETFARMQRIDREEEDRRLLDAGGVPGMAAQVAMGLLDPTIFIPGGTIYRGVKAGRAVSKSALATGASTGAMVAAQESILYSTQELRTGMESTLNIGVGTVVGGILGSAISFMSSRELAKLNQTMTGFRQEVTDEIASGSTGRPAAAGAASSQREGLNLAGAVGAEKAAARLSPVTRLQTSDFETSKATIRDMADAGLAYRENWDGVPTSEGGTVETRIKMRRAPLIEAISTTDDAYARYFFDKTEASTWERASAGMRAGWASVTGQMGGKMTAHEFREEVGRAMRRGDEHPIPQVAEAAKAYREKVLEPLKKEAIKLGLLPEDVATLGAESYLTRVYNRERIKAQRDRWSSILLNHFTEMRRKATVKFEEKQSKKIAALETELSDISTPAAARPALAKQLEAELDRVLSDNPAFGSLDAHLKELRARETAGRKAGEDTAAIRAEIKEAREAGGAEYAKYVSDRNKLVARLARLNRTGPADEAAAGARPETIAAFDASRKRELAEVRKSLDETLDILAAARDKELEQTKSIYNQRVASSPRKDRSNLRAKRSEAEARISEAHERAVRRAEREFAPTLRQFTKLKAAERKKLVADLSAAERSTNRAADLQELIQKTKAQRGGDLVELMPEELPALVDDVTNAIQGESIFRLPGLALIQGPKGPLRKRILNIPDEAIEEFLESDVEKVGRIYTQSMASDIEIAAKFGDVRMESVLKTLTDEFNAKTRGAKTEKARLRISRQFERDKADIGALRDRLRGNYAQPADPDGLAYRAGRTALNLNYVAKLGGMTISSLADAARPVMRYGIHAFTEGWVPLVTNFSAIKMSAREVRLAGTALDMVRDQRAMELADLLDDFGRNTKFERGVQWAADRFGMVSLMSPWNGGMKSMAGVITMAEVLRAAKAVAAGTATKKQIANLASGGVDESMAKRIWVHSEASGSNIRGVHLPNTESWRLPDGLPDTKVIEAFRAVINREVETLIVTPGLEKPLWMSSPIGRIIGQFKSFAMSSTQRTTLAGLQQRDAAALSGVLFSMGLGAFASYLKAQLRNEDTSKWTQGKWITEALDNSGLLGVLMEVNNMSEKVTRGRVGLSMISGKQVSRYASRNVMGSLLGPTADAAADLATLGGIGSEKWSHADTRALRKIIPLQNVFYLRKLFDKAEEGINSQFNIPAQRPRRQ